MEFLGFVWEWKEDMDQRGLYLASSQLVGHQTLLYPKEESEFRVQYPLPPFGVQATVYFVDRMAKSTLIGYKNKAYPSWTEAPNKDKESRNNQGNVHNKFLHWRGNGEEWEEKTNYCRKESQNRLKNNYCEHEYLTNQDKMLKKGFSQAELDHNHIILFVQ